MLVVVRRSVGRLQRCRFLGNRLLCRKCGGVWQLNSEISSEFRFWQKNLFIFFKTCLDKLFFSVYIYNKDTNILWYKMAPPYYVRNILRLLFQFRSNHGSHLIFPGVIILVCMIKYCKSNILWANFILGITSSLSLD